MVEIIKTANFISIWLFLILFFSAGIIFSCNHQATAEGIFNKPTNGNDSINQSQPKVDIKVNKEYDDQGNIIRFDSVYISTYSGEISAISDSLFNNFDLQNFNGQTFFNNPFDTFSEFNYFPEFDNDIFSMHTEQLKKKQEMMHKMDSLMFNHSPLKNQPKIIIKPSPQKETNTDEFKGKGTKI